MDSKNAGVLKNPLVIVLVIAALAIGYLYSQVQTLEKATSGTAAAAGNVAADTGGGQPAELPPGDVDPVTKDDHIKGDIDKAKVVMIEYSDTECPFCQRFHPTAQQLVDEYGDDLAWVYRHFPLDQIHSKARKEAEATECAAELGGNDGFWALLDKIFEVSPSNNGLDLAILPDLAEEVGLNRAKFTECLDSGKYADKVEEQYQSGVSAGVSGTPGSFLVNLETDETKMIPGALPFEQLQPEVEKLLGN